MSDFEKYEELIVKSGSKMTKQRRAVLEVLLHDKLHHFSAEEVYEFLKKTDDSIGIATVYRTLDLFENLKIVRNVKLKNDGVKYYDLVDVDVEKRFHYHLICRSCEGIQEIHDIKECYERFIKYQYGFDVTDHDLIFYGVCKTCGEQSKPLAVAN